MLHSSPQGSASGPSLTLRPATLDDALHILEWRNDPLTRAMSRDHALVEPDRHLAWFAGTLDDPARVIMIGEAGGDRVGLVRFDQGEAGWEVGINLNPAQRGKGLGRRLLADGVAAFRQTHPGALLTAVIRPDNAASRRIFTACGFRQVDCAKTAGAAVDTATEHDHFELP